ncbi:MAG: DUF167 family protein [Elusimicrobiota bacterium]|jgi:hypothetical protein
MIIRVRVIPGSDENEVVGRVGSVVRVRVMAPQINEAANGVLIDYLAEFFEVKGKSIHIMRGKKAREKTVNICGRSEDELKRVMESIP